MPEMRAATGRGSNEIGHGEVAARQQPHEAQPRRLAQRLQRIDGAIEIEKRLRHQNSHIIIKISLYGFPPRDQAISRSPPFFRRLTRRSGVLRSRGMTLTPPPATTPGPARRFSTTIPPQPTTRASASSPHPIRAWRARGVPEEHPTSARGRRGRADRDRRGLSPGFGGACLRTGRPSPHLAPRRRRDLALADAPPRIGAARNLRAPLARAPESDRASTSCASPASIRRRERSASTRSTSSTERPLLDIKPYIRERRRAPPSRRPPAPTRGVAGPTDRGRGADDRNRGDMTTRRQQAIARALTSTIPRVPYFDAEAIRDAAGSRRMRATCPRRPPSGSRPSAYNRHAHTDYDALLDEGYGRDAARFFVVGRHQCRARPMGRDAPTGSGRGRRGRRAGTRRPCRNPTGSSDRRAKGRSPLARSGRSLARVGRERWRDRPRGWARQIVRHSPSQGEIMN